MPLDVRGRTCATMNGSACVSPGPKGLGNPLNPIRTRDWGLQLFPMNEEFPVGASHQLASITSLPFVHTARRYYRSLQLMSSSDWTRGPASRWAVGGREDAQIDRGRGRKSRNKVSVGEPADGSLPNVASSAQQRGAPPVRTIGPPAAERTRTHAQTHRVVRGPLCRRLPVMGGRQDSRLATAGEPRCRRRDYCKGEVP